MPLAHCRPYSPSSPVTLKCGLMFKVASWNLNSVRSRLTHVTAWLQAREPDVLLLQELKGTEFPSEAFKSLGCESVAVTQKAYNGVAILSRHPMKTIAKALVGDDSDSHARFLEVIIRNIRIVNIYLPNGNPVGSDKFAYKLAWMDRLTQQMIRWKQDDVPTLIGGDFNVIPEDIDCHKPSSWQHDALFQPEPRARYRAMLGMGYTDAFRSLHVVFGDKVTQKSLPDQVKSILEFKSVGRRSDLLTLALDGEGIPSRPAVEQLQNAVDATAGLPYDSIRCQRLIKIP